MMHAFCRFNFSRPELFSSIRKAMVHNYFSYNMCSCGLFDSWLYSYTLSSCLLGLLYIASYQAHHMYPLSYCAYWYSRDNLLNIIPSIWYTYIYKLNVKVLTYIRTKHYVVSRHTVMCRRPRNKRTQLCYLLIP